MIGRAKQQLWILLGGTALLAVAGCSYKIDKAGTDNTATGPSISQGRVLGYNSLKAKIFAPHCISCHGNSGGVNLETYASALAAITRIKQEVVTEQSMPPTGPLADADRQLVQAWIDDGAPENDVDGAEPSPTPSVTPTATPTPTPTVTPTPSPTTTPAQETYANVRDRIFTPQCIRCHNSGLSHPSGGVTLDSYAAVTTYLSRVENELLVDQSMPPSGPLSSSDRAFFQTWVNEGALQ